MFDLNSERIFGYHLSDNDGLRDSNRSFNSNSWFWKYLENDKNITQLKFIMMILKNYVNYKKLTIQKLV